MLDQSSPLVYTPTQIEGKNSFALKRLRLALIECELTPGSQISEPEIATRYGLGRAAIRNALAQLAVDGLITALPRNGWLVAPIFGATIGNIINARFALEPQLARVTLTPVDIEQLRGLSVQLSALATRDEPEAIAAARLIDRKLMMMLATCNGALICKWINEGLDNSARLLAYFEGKKLVYSAPSRTNLVDALETGDREAATSEIRREVLRFKDYLIDQLLRSETISTVRGNDLRDMQDHVSTHTVPAKTNNKNNTITPTRGSNNVFKANS